MIEAVNSVLQNAPLARGNNEQVSTVDSFAANPERVQKAPQAPFISPYIYLDINYDKAVVQLRNGETGDVEAQFPSQAALEAEARARASRQVASENQRQSTPQAQSQSAQAFVQQTSPDTGGSSAPAQSAPTQQQIAAFQAAAQSGNSNAGNVTVFA